MTSMFRGSAIAERTLAAFLTSALVISSLVTLAMVSGPAAAELDVPGENWPVLRVGPGYDPVMALDQEGNVHLAYLNEIEYENGSSLFQIMYAVRSDGEWTFHDWAAESEVADITLALGPEGHVYIFYSVPGLAYHIWCLTNAGGDWNATVIDPNPEGVIMTWDALVDQYGEPHVVTLNYMDYDYESASILYDMYYLAMEGDQWTTEMLGTYHGHISGNEPPIVQLAVDQEGDLRLACTDRQMLGTYVINTTERTGGVWQNNRSLPLGGYVPSFSFQVDGDGMEHILYGRAPYGYDIYGTYELAVWTGEDWSKSSLGTGYARCQLVIDDEGVERFGYLNESWGLNIGHLNGSDVVSSSISPCFYYTFTDVAEGDFMARYDNVTWVVQTDPFTSEVILARSTNHGGPFPYFSNVYMSGGRSGASYRCEWDQVDPGTGINSYLVRSFKVGDGGWTYYPDRYFNADTTSFSGTPGIGETWLRLSVITADGEEYLGGLGFVEYDGTFGDPMDLLYIMLIGMGVFAGAIIILFITGSLRMSRPPGRLK